MLAQGLNISGFKWTDNNNAQYKEDAVHIKCLAS